MIRGVYTQNGFTVLLMKMSLNVLRKCFRTIKQQSILLGVKRLERARTNTLCESLNYARALYSYLYSDLKLLSQDDHCLKINTFSENKPKHTIEQDF